jgi:hypothetical protein
VVTSGVYGVIIYQKFCHQTRDTMFNDLKLQGLENFHFLVGRPKFIQNCGLKSYQQFLLDAGRATFSIIRCANSLALFKSLLFSCLQQKSVFESYQQFSWGVLACGSTTVSHPSVS